MSTILQKLSSRKLWLGVALVVIGIVLCVTGDTENGITIIKIGGIGYLGAETVCDIIRGIWTQVTDEEEETEDETEDTVTVTDETTTTISADDIFVDIFTDEEEET